MKTSILSLSLAAALALGLSTGAARAELDQISTGKVIGVSEDRSMLTIMSAQTKKPIVYYGLTEAQITAADGKSVGLDGVNVGANVSVHYLVKDKRLHVSRIVLPTENATAATTTVPLTPAPGTAVLPNAERRALKGTAIRDGDITTNPGSKAMIDNDITTQPGSNAATDGDITTEPGFNPLTDRDITTQPGKILKNDGDPTTKSAEKNVNKDDDITTNK